MTKHDREVVIWLSGDAADLAVIVCKVDDPSDERAIVRPAGLPSVRARIDWVPLTAEAVTTEIESLRGLLHLPEGGDVVGAVRRHLDAFSKLLAERDRFERAAADAARQLEASQLERVRLSTELSSAKAVIHASAQRGKGWWQR